MIRIFLVIAMSIVIGGGAGYFGGQFSNTVLEVGQTKETQAEAVSPAFNGPPVENYDSQWDRQRKEMDERFKEAEKKRAEAKKERDLNNRLNCLDAKIKNQAASSPEGRALNLRGASDYTC